ncbi:MAG: alpha/beta hydrolase [Reyranella sp.]|uniref:alpha/beta fold hydrolase n=1 Tax=Reyranella sp. TaxID=1929291 RepID=UPI002730C093|nr:alpha/beta hydrolase [Reyranella sp.]MDP1963993.1 alpha/beta hydrolase [Reyranella sp.]MDP2378316.1 alpha/beta hydrolase [Reyranella sp.]
MTNASVPALPAEFRAQTIATKDAEIHVRVGGRGPAVLLLHGYGETGEMWGPLASVLMADRTVIVPDLRGLGLSSKAATGYDKATQAREDIRVVLEKLGIGRCAIVAHDIGNMVAYAYAAQFPADVEKLAVIDAPLPGIGPWEQILRSPLLWHFNFRGPDAERLVAGRERIYLDRFWNEFSADSKKFGEAARAFYASRYAAPGGMRAGFAQFAAFAQDEVDNKRFAETKLAMPVLALGGENSFGATMAVVMRAAATDVTEGIVPNTGHWIMEENPEATVALVRGFLGK